MTESLLGTIVTRAIPPETLMGLATGQYKLYGGVIRGAPGTEIAGQIINHLLPVASQSITDPIFSPISGVLDMVNTYQLRQLTGQVKALTLTTQQVLQVANATMMLSGLNLAVSAVGFAVINQKLGRLESKLDEIQKDVKAIREMLELKERSELKAALRDLINVMDVNDPEHRRMMLFNAKNVLAPINLKYKELLGAAETLETAVPFEEYFCLTSLAHARCIAELGMLEMAQRDFRETREFWQEQSRRIVTEMLFGAAPERFLHSDFVEDVPLPVLIDWCDFAYGEEKGYDWIDELRRKTRPWYVPDKDRKITSQPGRMVSSIGKMVSRQNTPATNLALEKERVIPAIQKLVSRNNVIEGYGAQYTLLEAFGMTPSQFESRVAEIAAENAVDDYLILEPTEKQPGS